MSRLITTALERAANSFLDWDDASLGRAVKATALKIKNHAEEKDDHRSLWMVSAGLLMCNLAHESNAEHFKTELTDVTKSEEHRGNWRIRVDRITAQSVPNVTKANPPSPVNKRNPDL